jgi:hypothetical protein
MTGRNVLAMLPGPQEASGIIVGEESRVFCIRARILSSRGFVVFLSYHYRPSRTTEVGGSVVVWMERAHCQRESEIPGVEMRGATRRLRNLSNGPEWKIEVVGLSWNHPGCFRALGVQGRGVAGKGAVAEERVTVRLEMACEQGTRQNHSEAVTVVTGNVFQLSIKQVARPRRQDAHVSRGASPD